MIRNFFREIHYFISKSLLKVQSLLVKIFIVLKKFFGNIFLTFIAIFLDIYIVSSPIKSINVDSLGGILSTLGATFGTILALVFTLSIIPVQKAGEAWSSSIMKVYKEDRSIFIVFVSLSMLTLGSFILAYSGTQYVTSLNSVLIMNIMIGIGLDLLRWYYGHIIDLLDPENAILKIKEKPIKILNRADRIIAKHAKHNSIKLSRTDKESISLDDIKEGLYRSEYSHQVFIKSAISDLSEIAERAIMRGEKKLAEHSVRQIVEIINHYLKLRKNTIGFHASPIALLAVESDIQSIIDYVNDSLLNVSHIATSHADETTAICVSEAFRDIAIEASHIHPKNRDNSAPIVYSQVFYLFLSVKYAQEMKLKEMPYQSAKIATEISIHAPKNIDKINIHIPIIDGLYDIAKTYYMQQNALMGNEVVGSMMIILNQLLDREDYSFKNMLKHVLDKVELLMSLAIVNESLETKITMNSPLEKIYGLIHRNSLGYLYSNSTKFIKVDSTRPQLNPYYEIIKITDIIQRHFRNIAKLNNINSSMMLWEINELIKHIAEVNINLLKHSKEQNIQGIDELIDKFKWILSFFWVAFNKKESINSQRIKEASETLSYIGILFDKHGYPDILMDCIGHIRSLINSYAAITSHVDDYGLADLYEYLWGIRILAVAKNDKGLITKVDAELKKKPMSLSDEEWTSMQSTIVLRQEQLEERLKKYHVDYPSTFPFEDLLEKELQELSDEQ